MSLLAWYKAAEVGKATIVYFHGNAGHIGYRIPLVQPYINQGIGVLLLSYRGYGGNPGKATEQGFYNDGRAAMAFLKEQQTKPECTILFGESIGSAVAVQIATEFPIAGMVLQSPFTTLVELGAYHLPLLPVKYLAKEHYDTLSKIKTIEVPLLILQGDKDNIVPNRFTEKLFAAANEPKTLKTYPGYGHNDLFNQEMANDVLEFVQTHACS